MVTFKGRGAIAGRMVLAVLLVSATLPPAAEAQQIEWTRQFGGSSAAVAISISVDASGVYVAGFTAGTLPGQTSAGGDDAFVRKYDAAGNEVWTRQFGTSDGEIAFAISTDASGVYVAGFTAGTFPGQTHAGGSEFQMHDAFVRKYDAAGNEVWTRQFGTSSVDRAEGISADASGVYVAGWTGGTLPGQTSAGGGDAFVRKYDAAGNEVWTRQFGGLPVGGGVEAFGISADASGVYVAGLTGGTLPGETSAGFADAFVRKYDAAGNEVWTRQFGSSTDDIAFSISVDASRVYVAGFTAAGGTLPGQTNAGSTDPFVRKYDAAGNEVWTRQFGTPSDEQARAVSADASGVYVAGWTNGTLPGQTSGAGTAFVAKLSVLSPAELLQQLIADVVALNLKQGISNGLDAKLEAAVNALDDINRNNNASAIAALQAFINSVEAQRGIHISEADATALIAAAQAIIAQLGGS